MRVRATNTLCSPKFASSADDHLLTGNLSYWKLGQDNLRVPPFYNETGDERPFNQLFAAAYDLIQPAALAAKITLACP